MNWFQGKSIVVPIDHSEESIGAINFAERVSDAANAIHAIHVIPQINDPNTPLFGTAETILDDRLRAQARVAFEKWLCEHQSNVVTTTMVKVGDPGLTITDYATDFEDAVIVISSHGRTGINRVLMGSVAERVARHAHCPVLVLRSSGKWKEHQDDIFDGKPVIVPFDFSEESIAAVEQATKIVSEERDLHVLHVLPKLSAVDPGVVWDAVDDEKRKDNARESMEKALAKIAKGAQLDVSIGDPGHVIADLVKEIDAGLVVISSHGRTGIVRMFLGSVAERVVRHAKCSVLVLKSQNTSQQRLSEKPKVEDAEPDLRQDDLLTVYSTDDPNYAEVLRNALHCEGMKCEIDGEHQGGFAGLTSMPIRLLVRVEDYDRARK